MNFVIICIISSFVTVLVILPPPLELVSIVAGIRPGILLPLLVAIAKDRVESILTYFSKIMIILYSMDISTFTAYPISFISFSPRGLFGF